MTSSTRIDPAVPVRGHDGLHGRRAHSRISVGGVTRNGAEQPVGGWSAPLRLAPVSTEAPATPPVIAPVSTCGPAASEVTTAFGSRDTQELLEALRALRRHRGR